MRICALALALLLAAQSVRAEPVPIDAAARARSVQYFQAGRQAYDSGKYALAASAYEEAYAVAPLPEIAFSIAQAHRLAYYDTKDRSHIESALIHYRKYLDVAPDGRRRAHALIHVAALEEILAGFRAEVPSAPDAGESPSPGASEARVTQLMLAARTPGARGRIDGGELVDLPFAERVEPGKHRVYVEAPGFVSAETEWLAVTDRLVVAQVDLVARPARIDLTVAPGAEVHLDGRPAGTGPLSRPLEAPAGEHVLVVTQRGHRPYAKKLRLARGASLSIRVPSEPTSQRIASSWTLAGAGIAAIAGGVTIGLTLAAESDATTLSDARLERRLSSDEAQELNDALDRRDRLRTTSIVLVGSAVVLGVTGLLLRELDAPGADAIDGHFTW